MEPRRQKDVRLSLVPLAILSVAIGAFVIGAAVKAADVLTPPTALFPDQGSLPEIGGGGAGNLLEALKGGAVAKWADFKDDTVIGGRLGLGQIQGMASGTLRIAYPLDIQIVHNQSEDPTTNPANPYLNKNDAAVLRIASLGNTPSGRLWTGIQLARINSNPDNNQADPAFTEKWFIGMDSASDNLVIRANGSNKDSTKQVNIVDIDPDKGAACFGGVYAGKTDTLYDGRVNQSNSTGGGYVDANTACAAKVANSHVCTTEEMLRTITCKSNTIPSSGAGWVNKGPPGYTQSLSNDCKGWTKNTNVFFGGLWFLNAKGGYATLDTCDDKVSFLCCK